MLLWKIHGQKRPLRCLGIKILLIAIVDLIRQIQSYIQDLQFLLNLQMMSTLMMMFNQNNQNNIYGHELQIEQESGLF